jgi:phage shock protein A
MSIFQRISTLMKSNINSLISKAEDPEKILNQLIIDMKGQFLEARKMVAVAIADEKRLKRQYEQELGNAQEWEKKAMTAVRAGRDDLAGQALQRKGEHDTLAEQFQQQWMLQKQASDQLKDALTQLNAKIQEAQRKKNLLIARQKRAEAQKTIQDTMSGMNDTGAFDSFARMEEKVDRMEAEAEAATELGQHADGRLAGQPVQGARVDAGGAGRRARGLEGQDGRRPARPAALPSATVGESVESTHDIEAELEALLKEDR